MHLRWDLGHEQTHAGDRVEPPPLSSSNRGLSSLGSVARGLFVSNSGFTEDGLAAFGCGKHVVCMDGLDLFDAIDRELPLNLAIDRKVRCAPETGRPFERIRDLFSR